MSDDPTGNARESTLVASTRFRSVMPFRGAAAV